MDNVHETAERRARQKPNPPPHKWKRYLASGSYRRMREEPEKVNDEHSAELVRRSLVGRFL